MNIYINTGSKWIALAIGVAALVMSPLDGDGISAGCSLLSRLSYPLFHIGLLHALCNAWCLVTLVFYYDQPFWKILASYIIAVTIPSFVLSPVPAVGMSGMCFALMGMTTFVVARKWYFTACVAVFLGAGYLLTNVAATIHLYCYLVGLFVGFLNSPAPWKK